MPNVDRFVEFITNELDLSVLEDIQPLDEHTEAAIRSALAHAQSLSIEALMELSSLLEVYIVHLLRDETDPLRAMLLVLVTISQLTGNDPEVPA